MTTLYKTLIIDDEAPARARLKSLLAQFPETFTIIDEAKNGTEAKLKIESLNPDLIFLDIEMPGFTGFELLKNLSSIPVVVFCTAYDQYSLQAFETNSIDYLVKPVRIERLNKTVEKLKLFNRTTETQHILKAIEGFSKHNSVKKMTSLTVKKRDKLIFIKLNDISHFEASNKYVNVFTENETYLSEQSLTELEQKLPDHFLRVHRSFIINTNHVKEVTKYFNSRYIVTLNTKTKSSLTTGRSYIEAVKNWINA